MDHFGIGAGLLGAVNIYFQGARQTGRTTSLIESVKDGDRIVVRTYQEGYYLKSRLVGRGLKVDILSISPTTPEKLFEQPASQGRTIFDHQWLEDFYNITLESAVKSLDNMQRDLSGLGTAHAETQRGYEEMAKWGPY